MTIKPLLAIAATATLLTACGGDTSAPSATDPAETPAQSAPIATSTPQNPLLIDVAPAKYAVEPTHASLLWTVSHNGLSKYTARFTELSAELDFDPVTPENSGLTARINPLSVRTDHPNGPDWDTTLGTDEKWFNASAFPAIVYESTRVTLTGKDTGIIEGNLTMLGISQPVSLDVTFNGVRNFPYFGARDVIGFSATASLKRSDFGMNALLPAIGDEVDITIEVEFLEEE